ncbi:MAG: ferredoxin--NADP reductase [Rudaea sp.]|uniref:2Fe-2S iron-sulfur cluster-binding protein n=1 Tax=Rudaea sp. TaxID=2136325 RepID=UPI0039E5E3D3
MSLHCLRVAEVVAETADAHSLIFAIPHELQAAFRYRAGQFLTLRVPHAAGALLRCYSLSSSPAFDEAPRVTVKRVKDGRASNWICDHVAAGDELDVAAPAGRFVVRDYAADLLLCAGGSGVTPVFSILRTALREGSGRIFLLYANRDERSVIFRDALAALARENPARLQAVHWLDNVQGPPTAAQLAALAAPWRHAQTYVCGPTPFMAQVESALDDIAMPRAQVHIERFVPFADGASEADAARIEGDASDAACAIEVHLDGRVHRIEGDRQTPLLEALLAAGVDVPYSCQSGQCAACMCRLREGRVEMRVNDALDADDLAQGWILACQALPRSETLVVEYR